MKDGNKHQEALSTNNKRRRPFATSAYLHQEEPMTVTLDMGNG